MIGTVATCVATILLLVAPTCAWALVTGPATQVVAATRIASIADRIARIEVPAADRALTPAFQIADQSVPIGVVAISPGLPQLNPTYVSVPVRIEIDGRLVRTVYAGYRITTYVQTVVAARDLAPETILADADLRTMRVPFTGRPGLTATTFIGRKIRSMTAHGTILYPELTAVNEIVRAGMPALLIVHDGPVALAADVVARTSGGLGDTVAIFNPQTQKALSGVVTGPNKVELTLPGADE